MKQSAEGKKKKNLPESICATSVRWKLQLNKSHCEQTPGQTALEKCIDNSTSMPVLNPLGSRCRLGVLSENANTVRLSCPAAALQSQSSPVRAAIQRSLAQTQRQLQAANDCPPGDLEATGQLLNGLSPAVKFTITKLKEKLSENRG